MQETKVLKTQFSDALCKRFTFICGIAASKAGTWVPPTNNNSIY